MNHHLVNQIQHGGLINADTLHVVTCVTNPVRFHSRYRLAREFIEAMRHTPHVKLHVVEAAFGNRYHEVTSPSNPDDLQLRIQSEIWVKENLLNLGIRRATAVYPEAQYFAWVDADVFFRDPSWALETMHQLQHYPVIQPWSDCADLAFQGGILQHFKSFGAQHQRRIPKQKHPSQPYAYSHTGYSWACTREFWETTRGLMDFAILGSADHHQAFAMIGEVKDTVHGGMSAGFKRRCNEWQDRAMRITRGEVGFVPGRIEHEFHGSKVKRYYRERWQILIDHEYDPDTDIAYDSQGLIQLVGKPKLEQDIRLYNRSRCEDDLG